MLLTLVTTKAKKLTQPQALYGLGGIGKTQVAIQYAYTYRNNYHAVFWVNASTEEEIYRDYGGIANQLSLEQEDKSDQNKIIIAVKEWFATHLNWLLILDNADDLKMVRKFLPTGSTGHIILTMRTSAPGTLARPILVPPLDENESILLLLNRSQVLTQGATFDQVSQDNQTSAKAIAYEMGGLPLALDLAGAYIEQTRCGLAGYLDIYRQGRSDLLDYVEGLSDEYSHTVAKTWSLSFQEVEKKNQASSDLLRFCAFLAPDAIPEEILTRSADELGPNLSPIVSKPDQLNRTIRVLRDYSLITREDDKHTLTVHRLVQAVLRDHMSAEVEKQWKLRAVLAVDVACPSMLDARQWDACEQWLPHALVCATWIDQGHFWRGESGRLLNNAALYLHIRAQYTRAEPLFLRALSIAKQQLGIEHPDTAQLLSNLAELRRAQGKYTDTELLHKQALAIREHLLGAEHLDTAQSLNNLASLYVMQGKYADAELLHKRALAIREHLLGASHPDTAQSLNNLANLYRMERRFAEAEPLFLQALVIYEQQLGVRYPDLALPLNNLALVYQGWGKYEQAEPLQKRALSICEEQFGAEHPNTAQILSNLADLYHVWGKYEQAEPLYLRALTIYEQQLGTEHPDTAFSLNNLALFYKVQRKYTQSEPLYRRALPVLERTLGKEHPITRGVRQNYRNLQQAMAEARESEQDS